MLNPQYQFAWAMAVDAACMAVRTALEKVEQAGAAGASAEISQALTAVGQIPAANAEQPAVQQAAAVRLAQSAQALARLAPPGAGQDDARRVHMLEIAAATHSAAARAQAARFAALAVSIDAQGPLRPCLLAWSCHWDALGYYHEALGRMIAGVDRDGPDANLIAGLSGTLDTMNACINDADGAFLFLRPQIEIAEDIQLRNALESFAETIALDRKTLAEWRRMVADPRMITQPAGRAALHGLDQLDRRRAELHDHRMALAQKAAQATN